MSSTINIPYRWTSQTYLDFVTTLPCCVCHREGWSENHIVPHHLIGIGHIASGWATKAGDNWAMPMHKICHTDWHQRRDDAALSAQWQWVATTYMHAFACGVLRPARQHDRSQLLHISSMAFHGLLDVDSKDIAEYLARAWAGLLQAGILEVVEK